ncbi:MAG: DUF2796 domain-containing protein [Gammaproteobacteria bacterium]|nr:MAG: DUF2796 domain-containing protein [Gammaproteobacteria bacterium]
METAGMKRLGLMVFAGSTAAWAGLGVHEHGVADLTVAIEGGRVDLMLTAPTGDLVGLERAPANAAEHDSIRERVAAIEAGSWFAWSNGNCEQVSVEVQLPETLLADPGHADHGHGKEGRDHRHDHGQADHKHGDKSAKHDHGHHRHAEAGHKHRQEDSKPAHGHRHDHGAAATRHERGHDHDAGDHDHGHDHDHDHDHDHKHMDGNVFWTYRCDSGVRLRHVEVELFELLPLERIRVQAVSDRGQGAGRLTPGARRFNLP